MANPRQRTVQLLAERTDVEAEMLLELLTELLAKTNRNVAIDDVDAEVLKLAGT